MTSKYIAGPSPKYEPYPVNLQTISGFLMKNEQTSHVDVPTALRGLPGRGRGGASGHRERGRIVQRVEGLHGVLK